MLMFKINKSVHVIELSDHEVKQFTKKMENGELPIPERAGYNENPIHNYIHAAIATRLDIDKISNSKEKNP